MVRKRHPKVVVQLQPHLVIEKPAMDRVQNPLLIYLRYVGANLSFVLL